MFHALVTSSSFADWAVLGAREEPTYEQTCLPCFEETIDSSATLKTSYAERKLERVEILSTNASLA
jgi:hypothetical protein